MGLNNAGFNTIHVRVIGPARSSDPEIFSYAQVEQRIIVSADTDFGTLLALHQASFPSFILFRRTDRRPLAQLKFLLEQLERIEADLKNGAVVVFEDERIRIRSLPF